ncbi:MAG: 2-C-methyl-D-erythritol 2,4-cyclodiphosphate synthase [Oscillospiraceae bacterium]|nr:2-C-methyl-D-erythritol 2,4-cyclodiphosphate synthase [Oscillospiraceae bacterium]
MYRIGQGFDAHRFVAGRKLILGGVDVPHDKGLDGHSDADVLVHALMDALLGAAALGDIGKHFPPGDDTYKGANSLVLLEKVVALLTRNSYSIGNVDCTIVAQQPKLSPYIDKMRGNLAQVMGIPLERVSVKATTEEYMGYTGRCEGVAAQAVALLFQD